MEGLKEFRASQGIVQRGGVAPSLAIKITTDYGRLRPHQPNKQADGHWDSLLVGEAVVAAEVYRDEQQGPIAAGFYHHSEPVDAVHGHIMGGRPFDQGPGPQDEKTCADTLSVADGKAVLPGHAAAHGVSAPGFLEKAVANAQGQHTVLKVLPFGLEASKIVAVHEGGDRRGGGVVKPTGNCRGGGGCTGRTVVGKQGSPTEVSVTGTRYCVRRQSARQATDRASGHTCSAESTGGAWGTAEQVRILSKVREGVDDCIWALWKPTVRAVGGYHKDVGHGGGVAQVPLQPLAPVARGPGGAASRGLGQSQNQKQSPVGTRMGGGG